MLTLQPESFFILFICILFSAVTLRSMVLKKQSKKTLQCLQEATSSIHVLERKLAQLAEEKQQEPAFDEDLDKAKVVTNLQKSRMSLHQVQAKVDMPERYRYVHSLIKKGMGSDEIANVLSISPQEAMQLVTLSKLSSQK